MAEASAATTIFRYRLAFVYSSGCACLSHAGGHCIADLATALYMNTKLF
jgi:hypothetical protein